MVGVETIGFGMERQGQGDKFGRTSVLYNKYAGQLNEQHFLKNNIFTVFKF